MKKWIIFLLLIILIIAGSSLILLYPHTKPVDSNLEGFKYNVGNNESSPVTITVHGELRYSILGKNTFHGEIRITGEDLPKDPYERQPLRLRLHKSGKALMSYHVDFEKFIPRNSPDITVDPTSLITYNERYGGIFTNRTFSKITIEVRNQQYPTLITAQANNRQEALSVANELMDAYFKKFHLNNYILYF